MAMVFIVSRLEICVCGLGKSSHSVLCHLQTGCLKRFCSGLSLVSLSCPFSDSSQQERFWATVIVLCVCSGLVAVFEFTAGLPAGPWPCWWLPCPVDCKGGRIFPMV